jgi:ABC-type molybdate transport system permease subunit
VACDHRSRIGVHGVHVSTRLEASMQTLSQSLFILSFVLPPVALVLGVAALVMLRRRAAS